MIEAGCIGELREMRILLVDDDKTFCQLLTKVLMEKGHDVDWTTHSLEDYKKCLAAAL
jgi:DNA-binding response OmpR family regulator